MTRLTRIKIIHQLRQGISLEEIVAKFPLEEEEVREISTYNVRKVFSEKDVDALEELGAEEKVSCQ